MQKPIKIQSWKQKVIHKQIKTKITLEKTGGQGVAGDAGTKPMKQ